MLIYSSHNVHFLRRNHTYEVLHLYVITHTTFVLFLFFQSVWCYKVQTMQFLLKDNLLYEFQVHNICSSETKRACLFGGEDQYDLLPVVTSSGSTVGAKSRWRFHWAGNRKLCFYFIDFLDLRVIYWYILIVIAARNRYFQNCNKTIE